MKSMNSPVSGLISWYIFWAVLTMKASSPAGSALPSGKTIFSSYHMTWSMPRRFACAS